MKMEYYLTIKSNEVYLPLWFEWTLKNYTEWKKPVPKDHIVYVSIYEMSKIEKSINRK